MLSGDTGSGDKSCARVRCDDVLAKGFVNELRRAYITSQCRGIDRSIVEALVINTAASERDRHQDEAGNRGEEEGKESRRNRQS